MTAPAHHTLLTQARWTGPHGWQHHVTRTRNLHYRDRVLLPSLQPAFQALFRSQGGPHGGAWLAAVPSEPALTLAPQAIQLALRRRLRFCPCPCAPTAADRVRGAARRQTRTGTMPLPARERGCWPAARKSLSALGCELPARLWGSTGKLFPNSGWHTPRRWACRPTTADGSTSSCTERRHVGVRCAATQPSSRPPGRATTDGRRAPGRRAPKLSQAGPQQLAVLGSEVGGLRL